MGSLGISELFIILLGFIVFPVVLLVIAYRLGKRSGENKILRRLEEERRKPGV